MATTTTTTTSKPSSSSLATDEGVQVLSPFQVTSDKDYGYLKTNAATATKIDPKLKAHFTNLTPGKLSGLRAITDEQGRFRVFAFPPNTSRICARIMSRPLAPSSADACLAVCVYQVFPDSRFM